MQYIDVGKQSVGIAIKVLPKCLKTVFDEVHFMVNLLSHTPSPPYKGKSFAPSQSEQL